MILGTLGIFVVFGFLALILSGFAGHESVEEKVFQGEFSKEVTEARWKNLEDIQTAQEGVLDQGKVESAYSKVISSASKPAKTEHVIPGSPTFLKQAEEQAAPAADAPPVPKAEGGAAPAAKPAAEKPAPAQPAAEKPAVPVKKKPAAEKPAAPAEKKPAPAKPAAEAKAPAKPAPKASAPEKPKQ